MKRVIVISTALFAMLSACVEHPNVNIYRPRGTQEVLTPASLARQLDAWIPGMGAESIVERERPQQEFEQLCFRVGQPGAEAPRAALCRLIAARLGPQTPRPARVWMLRQLERIGRDESVPALARILHEPDPELADLARRALQKNPAASAGAVLRSALGKSRVPPRQVALLNALAARRDTAAVPRCARLAASEEMTVAAAAIAALGDVGSRAARDVLVKLCSAQESPRRELAGQALISVADRLVNEGHGAQAPRLYELVYRAAESTPLRAAALRGLAYTDPHQAMPRLIEASGGSDPALCRLAVRLLGEVPGPSAAEDLVRLLPTLAPDLQVVALAALAERGAGKTAVIAALASDDVRVRSAALEALQTLGGAGDVVTLATAAARASGSERDMARHSLARLRGPDVDDAILTSLPAAEPGPRSELIRALAARQCRRALPTLYEEAKQADETVRVAALGALGELSPPADAPALVLLLLATDGEASRAAAEDAVVAVCNRIEDVPARARPVLVRWNGASPAARCSLLRVLGRIGGPAALECIRAARQSDDADLVDAAVRALAKWASADVLDDLLDIARNSESKTHRVLTLEGFIRLLGLPSGREPQATAALYETALSLAERPEEKKAVLSGISSVPHVDALRLAQRCLADEEVRAEAESAVLGTARLVGPWQLDPAEAAVESILAKTTSDDTRERGTKTLEAIRKAQGCILTWSLTGPYFSEGQKWADVLDTAFAPEQPETSAVAWRPLKSTNTYQPWIFDLTQVDSGSDRCVYVQSHIWSPQSQDARLDVGSDDAVRVWLNGQRVHEFRGVRAHEPLQDQITVHLESGWNTLTLKVVQAGGGWGFSAALRTPDGQPLTGLRIQAEAP